MTTESLTAELARLNELDEASKASMNTGAFKQAELQIIKNDAIALANKLHGLLVQAEGALSKAVKDLETGPDSQSMFMHCWDNAKAALAGGCTSDLPRMMMESAADNVCEDLEKTLTAIRAAGIGGVK